MVATITPRVVFDTNVILSALLFRSGRVSWLVPLWQQGQIIALLSKETAGELLRVLAYPKFKQSLDEQHCLLQAFVPYAETVVTRSLTIAFVFRKTGIIIMESLAPAAVS